MAARFTPPTSDDLSATNGGGGSSLAALPLVRRYTTTSDLASTVAAQASQAMGPVSALGASDVVVDPARTFQTWLGCGAALTDATAYVLANYLTPAQRHALLVEAFGTNGMSTLRLPFGATDFQSPSNQYTYDDMPTGQTDPSMVNFSIDKDARYIIPIVQEILAINPRVKVIGSIWQPPAWMLTDATKVWTNQGAINGGSTVYNGLAAYIIAAVNAYQSYGIPVWAVTPQNEPLVPTYTLWTASQMSTFIGQYLGPQLRDAGLSTRILALDDNWNSWTTANTILSDATALSYIDGIAWHAYGGTVSGQGNVRRAYPTVEHHVTEWRSLQSESLAVTLLGMCGMFIGAIRQRARSVTLWNFALDQNGNPTNGSTGRRGVVSVQNDSSGTVTRSPEFWLLAHIGRFVQSGAAVVSSSSFGLPYTPYKVYPSTVISTAFLNPDGSVVVLAYNGAASAQSFMLVDARTRNGVPVTMAAGELSTFVWGLESASAATYTAPAAPTLTATGGAGEVNLSWSAPSSATPITGYRLYSSTTTGAETLLRTFPATATSYRHLLGAAGVRFYKLSAVSAGGESALSAEVTATASAAAAPAAPVVTVGNVNGTSVALSWPAADPRGSVVTAYTVNRGTSPGAEATLTTLPQGSTSYTDGTVASGTTYYYTVSATNATGTATSSEVSAAPSAVTLGTASTAQTNTALAPSGTMTWAHTVASTDNALVVAVSASAAGTATTVAGITYNGAALTKLASVRSDVSGGILREVDLYGVINPPVGTANVVITAVSTGGTTSVAAQSLTFKSATALGTPVTNTSPSANSIAATATGVTTGAFVAVCSARTSAAITDTAAGAREANGVVGSNMAYSVNLLPGATSATATYTWTTADQCAAAVLPIS